MHIFIPMLLLRIKRQRCRHDDREEKTKERVYLLFLEGGTRHITFSFIIIIERERKEKHFLMSLRHSVSFFKKGVFLLRKS